MINQLLGSDPAVVPTVGMAATILYWTDRRAATVVGVFRNGTVIHVQPDKATRTDKNGYGGAQEYTFAPNPEAGVQVFSKRQNGQYVRREEPLKGGTRVMLGTRSEYTDPSF